MAQENVTVTFDDYQWEQDEEWQILVKKLEFPPTFDERKKEKHLLKRKQRYFRDKIDPNFEPINKPKEKSPSEPSQPNTESNPHDPSNKDKPTTSSQSQPEPEPEPEPQPQSESQSRPQQSSTSSSSSSSSSSNYYRGGYQQYQAPPTAIGRILSPFLNYFYLLSQWFVFVSCLLSFINGTFYYRALYAVILMHIVATIQNTGKPQLNMWYAQRLMQDENVMIAIYAAIFLMGNPVFVFLSPIMLRSFYMGVFLMNGLMRAKLPSLHTKFRPQFQKILLKTSWFNQTVAMLEVLVGIFLIFACFFMSRTVILTFIYWQIMHARYMMSQMIQYAFRVIHIKIQGLLSKIPFLLNLYLKLAAFLWNMVDPQRIQQQMSGQQGAAAGGITGMLKKCSIM